MSRARRFIPGSGLKSKTKLRTLSTVSGKISSPLLHSGATQIKKNWRLIAQLT